MIVDIENFEITTDQNKIESSFINFISDGDCTSFNKKNTDSEMKESIMNYVFFPENLEKSFEFTKKLIEYIFSSVSKENTNYKKFFEIFSKNKIEELIINNNTNKFNTQARDLCIIHFLFEYKIALNCIKDKYISHGDSQNIRSRSLYEDFFKSVNYFQESFKCYFFYNDLLEYIKLRKWKDYTIMLKLENIIVLNLSEIGKYFNKIGNKSKFKRFRITIEGNCIYKNHIEEIVKCLSLVTTKLDIKEKFLKKLYNNLCDRFTVNPILSAISIIGWLTNKPIELLIKEYNYNDIFIAYESVSKLNPKNVMPMMKLFINCVSVYYLMFNSDINSFAFMIPFIGEYRVYENILKFNTDIIRLIWRIKLEFPNNYSLVSNESEKLINDIISTKEDSLLYLFSYNFNEEMIKFILEKIEASHISSKYIDDFILSKDPEKILNGFLLLGLWANVYPIKYIHSRILDVLFIFKKNVELRQVLTTEENIIKFVKGIYMLFKAFPKLSEDQLGFVSYLKENISYWISDYNLRITAEKMIDRTTYFVENAMIKSEYQNKNTMFTKLN